MELKYFDYLRLASEEAINDFLINFKTYKLGDLVDIIRPVHDHYRFSRQDEEIAVFEFSSLTSQKYGYALKNGRKVMIHKKDCLLNTYPFLNPFDIVITVKGSRIGRVSLLPEIISESEGLNWIINPGCVALRVKNTSLIDPHSVFYYLQSISGQYGLKKLIIGKSAKYISVGGLGEMLIPVPEKMDQQAIIESFVSTNSNP
jgi:restriction endonuclease S subunit